MPDARSIDIERRVEKVPESTLFILHIGKHKSGSSSIQNFLALNAEKLKQFGVLYPEIGRKKYAHHPLVRRIKDDPGGGSARGDWSDIGALGRAHPDKRIVISSEDLETLKKPHIVELQRQLGPVQTLIMMYIRDPAGLLPSKYNQLTKSGINVRDFDRFYEMHKPSLGYELARRMERRWAEVFGWESLRIRSLDSRSLTGGDLIEDLLSVIGVRLADLGGSNAPGLTRRNVSLGWKPTEVLRALYASVRSEVGRSARNPEKIRTDVGSLLRTSCLRILEDLKLEGERAQYLTPDQHAECAAAYSREIMRLNERIVGPKLPLPDTTSIGERPFLPAIESIPAGERAEIGHKLAELLESDALEDGSATGRRKSKIARRELSTELRQSLVQAVVGPTANE